MVVPALFSFPLLLVFLLLSSSPRPGSSADLCDQGDRATLLTVKKQFGNPPWLSTWLPASDCCSGWKGVLCDATGRVISVNISDIESFTTPPPHALANLSVLRQLQIINVSGFTGPIPPSFANLSQLAILEISFTSLSGAVLAGSSSSSSAVAAAAAASASCDAG